MQNRKIKVGIRVNKLKEVLEKLNKDSEFIYLDLDIEETNDVYKYLSTSDDIISWDFIEDKEDTKVENTPSIKLNSDDENLDVEIINPIHIVDYNEFATYIESVWRISIKSPSIKWGTNFFYKTLKEEYNNVASSPVSIEHALLVMILQTYYRNVDDITEAVEDTENKLKNNWNNLKNHPSLASVSKVLYE